MNKLADNCVQLMRNDVLPPNNLHILPYRSNLIVYQEPSVFLISRRMEGLWYLEEQHMYSKLHPWYNYIRKRESQWRGRIEVDLVASSSSMSISRAISMHPATPSKARTDAMERAKWLKLKFGRTSEILCHCSSPIFQDGDEI